MKRIIALLMIGMLIFNISACSDETVSSSSSDTAPITSDVTSSTDDAVSSEVSSATSSEESSSIDENTASSNASSDNPTASSNSSSSTTSSTSSSSSGDLVITFNYDAEVLLTAETTATLKTTPNREDVTPEDLSELLDVPIKNVVRTRYIFKDDDRNKLCVHVRIKLEKNTMEVLDKIYKSEKVEQNLSAADFNKIYDLKKNPFGL